MVCDAADLPCEFGLICSNACHALRLASMGSSRGGCFAVGAAPDVKLRYLWAPDGGGFRAGRSWPALRGGAGKFLPTSDQGLPFTPDGPGNRERLPTSYLAFSSGSLKISCADWMSWNLEFTSSSLPGLRSGWYCKAGRVRDWAQGKLQETYQVFETAS